MRTLEEIIEAAESIMATIDADCRARYGSRFKGFDEITKESAGSGVYKLVRTYGEGNRHNVFAYVAFFSRQVVEKGFFGCDYDPLLWYLSDRENRGAEVDSTDNPSPGKYMTLLTPTEIDILLDWIERMYRLNPDIGRDMWEPDTYHDDAIAHLRKIRAYTKSPQQRYWEQRAG